MSLSFLEFRKLGGWFTQREKETKFNYLFTCPIFFSKNFIIIDRNWGQIICCFVVSVIIKYFLKRFSSASAKIQNLEKSGIQLHMYLKKQ